MEKNNVKPLIKQPSINLRVFRRNSHAIILLYNSKELLSNYKVIEKVIIDNNNLKPLFTEEKSEGDDNTKFIAINTSKYNDYDSIKFTLKIKATSINDSDNKSSPITFDYFVDVFPKGITGDISEDKNKMTQIFGFNNKKKKWSKVEVEEEAQKNFLLVKEQNSQMILKLLNEINQNLTKLLKKK